MADREAWRATFEQSAEDAQIDLYEVNIDNEAELEWACGALGIGDTDFARKNQLKSIIREAISKRRRTNDDGVLRKLRDERDHFRMAALRARSTTERALAASDDLLYSIFEQAPTNPLWLPPLDSTKNNAWDAPWSDYAVTDTSRTETSHIQPEFNLKIMPKFPNGSPYQIFDTHNGWNRLTQDTTLFLRDRARVELTVAAIIELVGQDELGFPSKKHKAKFLRDCMRIYRRCGSNREVHGVITDLSRCVAVKMTGLDDSSLPKVVKTAVFEGAQVRATLTQFAFAVPHLLGVDAKRIIFPGEVGGTASRPIPGPPLQLDCGKVLGRGLHGIVYSVVGDGRANSYIKHFQNQELCQIEAGMLRKLDGSVPNIPALLQVSQDGRSFLASHVGKDSYHWQGHGIVWKIGLPLIDTLQQLHARGLCHRDVRPTNIVVLQDERPVLIDWVSVATIGTETSEYVGTVHYAAEEVLNVLVDGDAPTPAASYDLESLVYSVYSLSREVTSLPLATKIEKYPRRPEADFYAAVRTAWQQEVQRNGMLQTLVESARRCDYDGLRAEFSVKF